VSIEPVKLTSARRSLWLRTRFQLPMGLLLAVLLPWMLRLRLELDEELLVGLTESVIGSAVAVIGGYFGFRRLSRYPGVRTAYHILPVFSAAFGLVLAYFFFVRIDYSRLHFAASYFVCIAWFYAVYFKLQRQQRLRIAVVPFGNVESLFSIPDVDWVRLDAPRAGERPFDAVVADLRADIPDEYERFLADMAIAGMLVMHVKQLQESLTGRVAIEHLSENNFGSLIPGIVYAKSKRAVDLLTALLALPLCIPLFALIALLIRLDSPGPIFFTQQRMGYRGRTFRMIKFRTMIPRPEGHEDARDAAVTKDADARVTRIGRVLRHYRLDELPQVLNILKGEMSWIGPRPEAVPLSQWYEAELPFYRYRHIVRPGITGWAQVKQGHVAAVEDVLWKLQYDFYYIKNFSFWLDVLIVAGTVRTVLGGYGAK
jgi:lipopolysaccharide/colanic/teichoic acid biosynthesis glycosyltransferase